jgi:glycerophosphoryl diester phosphodiesterase
VLPPALELGGHRAALKYHKCNSGLGHHPPNSLSALAEALDGGAEVVEFDVNPMRDGGFALLHDATLSRETGAVGSVADLDVEGLRQLTLRGSTEPPATLDQAVAVLAHAKAPVKVQVDLKAADPITPTVGRGLLAALEPARANAALTLVIGCLGDWNLRLLRRLDPTIGVGFDPAFYLHAPGPRPLTRLPMRVNAFGYVDDHPLGFRRAMPVRAYLQDRLASLAHHVPGASEYYLHRGFVSRALADDVNPVEVLRHAAGPVVVDVWTINYGDEAFEEDLRAAVGAGADQLTTDTAVQLATWAGTT